MKNSVCQLRIVAIAICASLFGCETSQEVNPTDNQVSAPLSKGEITEFLSDELKENSQEKILANPCEEYSLVLAGSTGTPHIGGLQSVLVNVNIATGVTTAASSLVNASLATTPPIMSMTGITRLPTNNPVLYGVTGINSNFSNSLFKIDPATGNSYFVANTVLGNTTTQISLQDIEYSSISNRYYAIREGSSQIMVSSNAINWSSLAFAPTNLPLNGLTTRNNRIWVIAGAGNTLCGINYGNMYQYNLGGGYIGSNSYNAANVTWTNKELGLTFYSGGGCVAKNFVVGSASAILSNNMTLCPAVPNFISQIKPTYDFAKR